MQEIQWENGDNRQKIDHDLFSVVQCGLKPGRSSRSDLRYRQETFTLL